jgi:hypothetical protein
MSKCILNEYILFIRIYTSKILSKWRDMHHLDWLYRTKFILKIVVGYLLPNMKCVGLCNKAWACIWFSVCRQRYHHERQIHDASYSIRYPGWVLGWISDVYFDIKVTVSRELMMAFSHSSDLFPLRQPFSPA